VATARQRWDFTVPDTTYGREIMKYTPLDEVLVLNNSSVAISIILNDDGLKYPCNAYSQFHETARGFSRVTIVNESAATAVTAGDIIVTVKRQPASPDSLTQSLVRRFPWLVKE